MPPPDDDEAVLAFLEPGQLSTARSRPVPRAHLSSGTYVALWALRVIAVLLTVIVTYTFIAQLT